MRLAISLLALAVFVLPSCRKAESPPDPGRLVAELRGPDEGRRGAARLQLIALGEAAVPALVELLRSDSPEERLAATNTLWGMGARAGAAASELATLLADPDPRLRVAAAMTLEALGPAAAPAVEALVTALFDRDPALRQSAVKALGAIGPGARAALPALSRVLRRGSWPEAEEAARRIGGVVPEGDPAEAGGAPPSR
jgi:HEAT repeat protein